MRGLATRPHMHTDAGAQGRAWLPFARAVTQPRTRNEWTPQRHRRPSARTLGPPVGRSDASVCARSRPAKGSRSRPQRTRSGHGPHPHRTARTRTKPAHTHREREAASSAAANREEQAHLNCTAAARYIGRGRPSLKRNRLFVRRELDFSTGRSWSQLVGCRAAGMSHITY